MPETSQFVSTIKLPRLAQSLWLSRRPFGFLDRYQSRFGDRFWIQLAKPFGRMLVVSAPESVKDVFAAPVDVLCGGLAYDGVFPFVADSALARMKGDAHKEHRKHIQPLFGEHLVADNQHELARQIHIELDAVCNSPVDIRHPIARIVARFATWQVFGTNLPDADFKTFQPLAAKAFANAPNLDSERFAPLRHAIYLMTRANNSSHRVHAKFKELLHSRIHLAQEGSLVDSYRRMSPNNPEFHNQLTAFWAFLFGATYSATMHVVYSLLQRSSERDKLQAMIAANDSGGPAAIGNFNKEVRRILPDVAGPLRAVTKPTTIGDVRVPAGSFVMACCYLAHRRSQTFERPLEFRPDRFGDRSWSSSEYFPFGGGERTCLGRAAAVRWLDFFAGIFLQRYRVADFEAKTNPIATSTGGLTIRSRPVNCSIGRL